MKKSFLIYLMLLPLAVMAGERSVEEAAQMAAEFMNEQYAQSSQRRAACSSSSFILSHTRAKLNSEDPAFYVFNKSTQDGYVIVSADDRTEDVLVYSDHGTLDMAHINPNFAFWLGRLQEEISAVNDTNGYTPAQKKARKATMATAIGPLLVNAAGQEITWYQESPYYNQCPMDERDNTRCLTGCVATAAAMIMYKWRHPIKGTGSHSYTWTDCLNSSCSKYKDNTLSLNFANITFDWDNMLPAYDGVSTTKAQTSAVATLMYACGVACDMDYGGNATGGSGAWTDDMGYGLVNYFGYRLDHFITTYSKSEYEQAKQTSCALSNTEWNQSVSQFTTEFNAELEAGRPILMGGEDNSGGHEFVCDGRNASGYFHINWGWEGEGNNYCKLSALKPEGESYNFSSEIDALIGLQPNVIDTVHVTGVSVAPTSLTLKQKEKGQLTATVTPSNATFKSVTWSSSNSAVATVSATGQVTGVSQGNATITVTTTDGALVATCAVTVTNEIIETIDCYVYSYDFTAKCAIGTAKLGRYSWTVSMQNSNAYVGYDTDQTLQRGAQYGSSKGVAAGQLSFTTTDMSECLVNTLIVNACTAKDGDAKLSVYIDGKQIGSEQSLTNTKANYTFTNTADEKGTVEIRFTNSKKAVYIKSININPDGPTALDEVTDGRWQVTGAKKCIIDGQLYIQMGEHWYNAQGSIVR